MIRTIAFKELLELLREGRAKWVAGVVFLLLLAALAAGWDDYRETSRQHAVSQQTVREQWLSQPEQNPHSGVHYGIYAFKPKRFLASVDPGLDPYTGIAVWVEAHNQNQFDFKPAEDATGIQRFGEMSGARVLQILVPLLIILASFSAFAGEKEAGTLRQLIGAGVSPVRLAVGKAAALAAALGLLLVPAASIGLGTQALLGDSIDPLIRDASRIASMGALYTLYFGIFIALSLAVSARARSSRMALICLLGFWIWNSLVAPRLVSDTARLLHPTPSSLEFESGLDYTINYGWDGKTTSRSRAKQLEKDVLARYGVETLEELPVNFYGLRLQANEEWGYRIFDQYFGDLWRTYEAQNRFREWSGLLAPLLAVRSLSMGLTGTDWAQHRDFTQAAEAYRRDLVRRIDEDITYNGAGIEEYTAGRELCEQIPDFHYEARPLSWSLGNHWTSLGVVLTWLVLTVALAWLAARNLAV